MIEFRSQNVKIHIWFKMENIILQYSSDQEVDTSTNCHQFNASVENLRPRNFACIIGPSICYVACCILFETERNCVRNCLQVNFQNTINVACLHAYLAVGSNSHALTELLELSALHSLKLICVKSYSHRDTQY